MLQIIFYYIVALIIIRVNHYRILLSTIIRWVLIMTVHDRIAELLTKKNWTKYKLAKMAGFYPTTVYDWFNEKHYTPDRNSIELVCAAFDISLSEFYSGIDEDELDEEQILLLELFSKVPADKKKIVFDLLRTLSDEK